SAFVWCPYIEQGRWGSGSLPSCESLNEECITARCTQLHKCYSFFMACVHNMASVGDREAPVKAGKILKFNQSGKSIFHWTSSFSMCLSCALLFPVSFAF
ncbi:hypothetical protein ILYODFUR_000045, partial [Ilyodon furcidens]